METPFVFTSVYNLAICIQLKWLIRDISLINTVDANVHLMQYVRMQIFNLERNKFSYRRKWMSAFCPIRVLLI